MKTLQSKKGHDFKIIQCYSCSARFKVHKSVPVSIQIACSTCVQKDWTEKKVLENANNFSCKIGDIIVFKDFRELDLLTKQFGELLYGNPRQGKIVAAFSNEYNNWYIVKDKFYNNVYGVYQKDIIRKL